MTYRVDKSICQAPNDLVCAGRLWPFPCCKVKSSALSCPSAVGRHGRPAGPPRLANAISKQCHVTISATQTDGHDRKACRAAAVPLETLPGYRMGIDEAQSNDGTKAMRGSSRTPSTLEIASGSLCTPVDSGIFIRAAQMLTNTVQDAGPDGCRQSRFKSRRDLMAPLECSKLQTS